MSVSETMWNLWRWAWFYSVILGGVIQVSRGAAECWVVLCGDPVMGHRTFEPFTVEGYVGPVQTGLSERDDVMFVCRILCKCKFS